MEAENDTEGQHELSVSSSGTSLVAADGGMSSRKLWYGIGTSLAIVLGGVFFAFVPGFRTGYDTYIAGLMGVLALYVGGNVANKHVVAKHLAAQAKAGTAKKLVDTDEPDPVPPVEPLPPDGDEQ
jgi:hypothetical protein